MAKLGNRHEDTQLIESHGITKKQNRSELQELLVRRINCFVLSFCWKLEKIGRLAARLEMIGRFKSVFAHWTRRLRRQLAGERYHPELHYMRGPGPKTKAKTASGQGARGS